MNAHASSIAARIRQAALVAFIGAAASCDAPNVSWNPVAPPPTQTQPPDLPAPSVYAITPDAGSIAGAARVTITGSGFLPGATASLGGRVLLVRPDHRDPAGTILYGEAPAHGTGMVDLIVTNPGGRADTLVGAFTYALPSSFDFDGDWWGFGIDGQDIPILFSVRNGLVTSVSCDAYETLTLEPPARVSDGEFSYFGDYDTRVTARIVSATQAVGSLNLAPCSNTIWSAEKYVLPAVSGTASRRSLGTGSK